MKEHISAYIKELNALYQTGLTTEHSFHVNWVRFLYGLLKMPFALARIKKLS